MKEEKMRYKGYTRDDILTRLIYQESKEKRLTKHYEAKLHILRFICLGNILLGIMLGLFL
jgi:hypothetical protein